MMKYTVEMSFKYDNERDDQNDVEIISIRCSNSGTHTSLSMDNMNTNYKYIVTFFLIHCYTMLVFHG